MDETIGPLAQKMELCVEMYAVATDPVVVVTTIFFSAALSLLTVGAVVVFRKCGISVASVAYCVVLAFAYAYSPWLEVETAKCAWLLCNPRWMSIGVFSWPFFWVPWLFGVLVAIAYWYSTRSGTCPRGPQPHLRCTKQDGSATNAAPTKP